MKLLFGLIALGLGIISVLLFLKGGVYWFLSGLLMAVASDLSFYAMFGEHTILGVRERWFVTVGVKTAFVGPFWMMMVFYPPFAIAGGLFLVGVYLGFIFMLGCFRLLKA